MQKNRANNDFSGMSEDESTKPVKGGQQSPFLNLLIQKPFISQSQYTIEAIVQLQQNDIRKTFKLDNRI